MSTDHDAESRCAFCDEELTLADNWRHHAEFVSCVMNLRRQRDEARETALERSITVEESGC